MTEKNGTAKKPTATEELKEVKAKLEQAEEANKTLDNAYKTALKQRDMWMRKAADIELMLAVKEEQNG